MMLGLRIGFINANASGKTVVFSGTYFLTSVGDYFKTSDGDYFTVV